jgi:hypothetical protein
MRSVVTYWQVAEDEKEFIAFLQTTGTIVAVPAYWAETEREVMPEPILSFIGRQDPDQLLLGLEGQVHMGIIEGRQFDGQLRFGVDAMKSRVIHYRRGRIRDGRLSQSNIAAYSEYPSEDASKMVAKDGQFWHWVKSVTSWIRKRTPERIELNGYHYRATRRAKTAAVEATVQPVF